MRRHTNGGDNCDTGVFVGNIGRPVHTTDVWLCYNPAMAERKHSTHAASGSGREWIPAGIVVALALLGLILQILATGPLRNTFWGFHSFAFVPALVAITGWFAVTAATVWFVFDKPVFPRRAGEPGARPPLRILAAALALAAGFAAVFWLFRSHQTFLGDAQPLIRDLPGGKAFHPRQPLSMYLQQLLYRAAGPGGVDPGQRAFDVVAAGSAAAGFLFSLVVSALGLLLARRAGGGRREGWLFALVMLVQGYTVLFYGYVENYTFAALAVALYALSAVLHFRGRMPLAGVAVVLVAATGLHLSMVCLYPSFLYLAGRALRYRTTRLDGAVGSLTLVVAVVLLDRLVGAMSSGYSLFGGFGDLADIAAGEGSGPAGAGIAYLFSARHARDFFNNQYLMGPMAGLAFVPLLVAGIVRKMYRDPVAVFLSLASATLLAGSWATAELQLGYARDWDLFAPAAVLYAVTALYLLIGLSKDRRESVRVLLYALVVSAVYTLPWVWINHDEAMALERFKTLPLGGGRTELVVGNWYRQRGDVEEAQRWFERSLGENPNNVDANSYVGVYHAEQGRYAEARPYFERAVRLRPDKKVFRTNYANVLLELGMYDEALPHLVWLARRYPGNLQYWHRVGAQMEGAESALARVYEPVLARLDEKIAGNPRDETALINRGLLLARIGRLEEALSSYNRALDLDPQSAGALFNAALALERAGRDAEARPLYARFVEYHPDHDRAGYARSKLEADGSRR